MIITKIQRCWGQTKPPPTPVRWLIGEATAEARSGTAPGMIRHTTAYRQCVEAATHGTFIRLSSFAKRQAVPLSASVIASGINRLRGVGWAPAPLYLCY